MADWIKPVDYPVVAGGEFGAVGHGHLSVHQGVDLGAPNGTTVMASASGTVSFEGLSGSYGNLIVLNHPNGDQTKYAHLSKFLVPKGATVQQGDAIALSGGIKGAAGSGDATGPHLHTEHIVGGKAVDPVPYWSGTVPQANAQTAGLLDGINGTAQVIQWISTPGNWIRIGLFSLGTTLIMIAVIKILADTPVGKQVIGTGIQTAKTAAKVAVLA